MKKVSVKNVKNKYQKNLATRAPQHVSPDRRHNTDSKLGAASSSTQKDLPAQHSKTGSAVEGKYAPALISKYDMKYLHSSIHVSHGNVHRDDSKPEAWLHQ